MFLHVLVTVAVLAVLVAVGLPGHDPHLPGLIAEASSGGNSRMARMSADRWQQAVLPIDT